jgi:protein-disulfide isomerase
MEKSKHYMLLGAAVIALGVGFGVLTPKQGEQAKETLASVAGDESTADAAVAPEEVAPAEEAEASEDAAAAAPKEEATDEAATPEEDAAKPDSESEESASPALSATEVLGKQGLELAYGKEDAPVTAVEYFSLSCPHCAEFY